MQPKSVLASTFTSASPPRMKPTNTLARLTSRVAIPPSAMIPPASTKNGIASSAKSSVPSEILSITASSGMSTHSAARIAPRPSAYATGTPTAHRIANEPSRTRMSIAYSTAVGWSRYMIELAGGWPTQRRSRMNSKVRTPPIGIGM